MHVKNMKITRIKKKKNNIYEIELDNRDKIDLYDDVILKYELLLKKDIDNIKEIINDNNKLECYYIALKYINIKLRTEKEIRKRLKNYSSSLVNDTIKRLRKENYLNDQIYIKAYINDQINLKNNGPSKILYDLKLLGFKDIDINNYLDTIDNNIWLDKINKYIKKSIDTNHKLSAYMLKNKIYNDLVKKGYYSIDINSLLDTYTFIDNEDIYIKEYNKLKKKYEKKYEGNELEYKIKNSLYQKGFR